MRQRRVSSVTWHILEDIRIINFSVVTSLAVDSCDLQSMSFSLAGELRSCAQT